MGFGATAVRSVENVSEPIASAFSERRRGRRASHRCRFHRHYLRQFLTPTRHQLRRRCRYCWHWPQTAAAAAAAAAIMRVTNDFCSFSPAGRLTNEQANCELRTASASELNWIAWVWSPNQLRWLDADGGCATLSWAELSWALRWNWGECRVKVRWPVEDFAVLVLELFLVLLFLFCHRIYICQPGNLNGLKEYNNKCLQIAQFNWIYT